LRLEGIVLLAPAIGLVRDLEELFWPTIYPAAEDNDLGMRLVAAEAAGRRIAAALGKTLLTRSGLDFEAYQTSREVGYEKDAASDARKAVRKDAVDHKKLTAEEFDKAFGETPKQFYLDASDALAAALPALDRLEELHREKFGDETPNLEDLRQAIASARQTVAFLLKEKRKVDPDSAPVAPSAGESKNELDASAAASSEPIPLAQIEGGPISSARQAYSLVVASALYLFEQNPASPVPYLICAGLRSGETLMQGDVPNAGFAVGASAEVRLKLRSLAATGNWNELLRQSLLILASESARAWLDLHRYIWKAGQETGAPAISRAVQGNVKSLLAARPQLRNWTLEDDTGAANPETLTWLDSL
jgi:type VI secretion system protein ImpA